MPLINACNTIHGLTKQTFPKTSNFILVIRLGYEHLAFPFSRVYLPVTKMDFYLMGEDRKKAVLSALLKQYARDKSVERLASALAQLLETSTQRKLLKHVR